MDDLNVNMYISKYAVKRNLSAVLKNPREKNNDKNGYLLSMPAC